MNNLSDQDLLLFILVISLIIIFIFLLIREILMWYWKINKRIELFVENNKLLKDLIEIVKSKDSLGY